MPSRGPLLLPFGWSRMTIAATLGCYLACLWILAGPVYALDPSKQLTQYMHSSWPIQNGSLPAGMFSIAQTSDGFLWFSSPMQGMYRFDGVRFLPWHVPAQGGSINTILKVFGDRLGGLWVICERGMVHLKGGVVTSHFQLEGLQLPAHRRPGARHEQHPQNPRHAG